MNERESRAWWVVHDGYVVESEGLSCAPGNPNYWWFPRLRVSACEGFHVFATKAEAVIGARKELETKIAELQKKLADL